jgi:hypothetical protein
MSIIQTYLKFSFRLNLVLGILCIVVSFQDIFSGNENIWFSFLSFMFGSFCLAQAVIKKGKLAEQEARDAANLAQPDYDDDV